MTKLEQKQKELIEHLMLPMVERDFFWYKKLHQLESEISALENEKEGEKERRGNCPDCNGFGYTAEHDLGDPHPDGECSGGCPIQVQCEKCEGTGWIKSESPAKPEAQDKTAEERIRKILDMIGYEREFITTLITVIIKHSKKITLTNAESYRLKEFKVKDIESELIEFAHRVELPTDDTGKEWIQNHMPNPGIKTAKDKGVTAEEKEEAIKYLKDKGHDHIEAWDLDNLSSLLAGFSHREMTTEVKVYPAEFLEFLQNDCEGFNIGNDRGWKTYGKNLKEEWFKSTKELFTYWQSIKS